MFNKISHSTGVIGFLPFLSLCETKMSTFTVVDKTKFIPQKKGKRLRLFFFSSRKNFEI